MAEMGSKGGKVGGKRRAERMTPEARKASASIAARARWGKANPEMTAEEKRKIAARKIASILEQAMDDMGLSESEKDAKVSEMTAIVNEAVSSKTALRAKQPARLHTAESLG